MNSRTLHLSALSAALLAALPAWGVGFGDIVMHSRIGEPLRAEVPIKAEPGENIESSCFSLATLDGSDLPVISAAKTKLVRSGDSYRLQITGSKPVSEPIFVMGLRAGCGIDLQRDYVLMPSEPLVLAAPAPAPAAERPAAAARTSGAAIQEWRASEGDTLEGIAETLIPDNLVQQRRMLAALKRANPQLSGRPGLADGTPVVIPDIKQKIPAERDSLPPQQAKPHSEPPPPPPAPKEKPKPKVEPPPKPAAPAKVEKVDKTDRVVLGAPPAEIQPGEKATPQKGSREELNDRMRKMEVTIQSLNAQIEALDKALALTTEAIALQQKLQAAQAAQAAAGALPAPVAKPAEAPPASNNTWLEVLLSALAGGIIAAGIAHYLGRRRERHGDDQLPLAGSDQGRSEPASPAPPATLAATAHQGPAEPEMHLDAPDQTAIEVKAADAHANPDDAAISLAEIMLTFGRNDDASEVLAKHIDENAPASPRPWLMLLDLYKRHGKSEEYAKLLPALRQKLNLKPPAWEDVEQKIPGLKTLEDYAHIAKNLKRTWGTAACMEYLDKLIHDTRDGQRAGFPLYVMDEIMLLMHVLEDAYGVEAPL